LRQSGPHIIEARRRKELIHLHRSLDWLPDNCLRLGSESVSPGAHPGRRIYAGLSQRTGSSERFMRDSEKESALTRSDQIANSYRFLPLTRLSPSGADTWRNRPLSSIELSLNALTTSAFL
jgi:hypothetical protein